MSNEPKCMVCGRSGTGVQFQMIPRVSGVKFGELCVDCETAAIKAGQK